MPERGFAGDSPHRLAFIGDSMADGLWGGVARLTSRGECFKGVLELGRFAKNGTGLTRVDQFSWPRETKRIGENFRPEMFIVSLGLNDRQSVVDPDEGRAAWKTDAWTIAYRREITAVLRNAMTANAGLLWVGLPAMRDAVANDDALEKNKLFADTVESFGHARVHYVEPWALKTAGNDVFASYGPDKDGRVVQLRTPDGIHFTAAGYDLVVAHVFPKIAATFREAGAILEESCANSPSAHGSTGDGIVR